MTNLTENLVPNENVALPTTALLNYAVYLYISIICLLNYFINVCIKQRV